MTMQENNRGAGPIGAGGAQFVWSQLDAGLGLRVWDLRAGGRPLYTLPVRGGAVWHQPTQRLLCGDGQAWSFGCLEQRPGGDTTAPASDDWLGSLEPDELREEVARPWNSLEGAAVAGGDDCCVM